MSLSLESAARSVAGGAVTVFLGAKRLLHFGSRESGHSGISIPVDNDSLGGDPAPGTRKVLRVVYYVEGNEEQTHEAYEGDNWSISALALKVRDVLPAYRGSWSLPRLK